MGSVAGVDRRSSSVPTDDHGKDGHARFLNGFKVLLVSKDLAAGGNNHNHPKPLLSKLAG
jgi:hypothetical protein